jgi:osmotically-inducible protein OsmY
MTSSYHKQMKTFFFAIALGLLPLLGGCSTFLAIGNSGPVEDDYSKRTWGSYFDDKLIVAKANVNLQRETDTLRQAHLVVRSYNGVVLLAGQVSSNEQRLLAGSIVKKIRKVRRVNNELSISGPTTGLVRLSDGWLNQKVKTRLRFTPKIKSGRIQVFTENGTVFLMGLVTREESNRIVEAVQKTHGIQKIVKAFEYIDEGSLY